MTDQRENTGSGPSVSYTCPSAPLEANEVVLLGLVGPTGRVAFISPTLPIDDGFVAEALRGRPPGKRFRFAGPCRESDCAQWTGDRCAVIDSAIATQDRGDVRMLDDRVPRCPIRQTCRWFAQTGPRACHVCPLVVYDGRTEEGYAETNDVEPTGPPALAAALRD